jgi:hypothetical protein
MSTASLLRQFLATTGLVCLFMVSPFAISGQLTAPVDTIQKGSAQVGFPLTLEVKIEVDEAGLNDLAKRLSSSKFSAITTTVESASNMAGKRCWITFRRQHIQQASALNQAIADVNSAIGPVSVGETSWTLRPDLTKTITVNTHP